MDNNTDIGILVKKAKGDDRSLREYARDSGVDAAIISKIIHGTYVPKKPDVYKLLTSKKAAPRGGVTYKQLVEAANTSKSYQEGIKIGIDMVTDALTLGPLCVGILSGETIPLVAGALAAIAINSDPIKAVISELENSLTSAEKGRRGNKADDAVNEIKRFIATSNGLIFGAMGRKAISFQISSKCNQEVENPFDTYLMLTDREVKEYLLRYAYFTKENQNIEFIVKSITRRIIEELIFLNPSNTRKVTIVTNATSAFEYLLSYSDNLSYNGDISIILVDDKKAELQRESYISHYLGENAPKEFYLV